MPYVRPEDVVSPRSHVGGVIEVIHDCGENDRAVARILWDSKEYIAARWNGNNDQPLGSPVARGHATWFLVGEVGDYLADKVEEAARLKAESSPNSLVGRYREMAQDRDREHEAEEWTEGLIGDASA
jgi:hypothetical protein